MKMMKPYASSVMEDGQLARMEEFGRPATDNTFYPPTAFIPPPFFFISVTLLDPQDAFCILYPRDAGTPKNFYQTGCFQF